MRNGWACRLAASLVLLAAMAGIARAEDVACMDTPCIETNGTFQEFLAANQQAGKPCVLIANMDQGAL